MDKTLQSTKEEDDNENIKKDDGTSFGTHDGSESDGLWWQQGCPCRYLSADLGDDGVITWMFDGKGKCTMENAYMKQDGTYSIEDDQLTVTLESWSDPSVYTFSVDGSNLTMSENSGYGISGTFEKK